MEKNKDLEISLLDAPVGAVVDCELGQFESGRYSQTDGCRYLFRPSADCFQRHYFRPCSRCDQQRARRHRTSRCKGAQSSLEQRGR